jgi:hypothetical protein
MVYNTVMRSATSNMIHGRKISAPEFFCADTAIFGKAIFLVAREVNPTKGDE